jgi:pimeloyl-ACP methyl ester carboxylesterase
MLKQIIHKGITVTYQHKKGGKSTVVLLHGFLESHRTWKEYAKILSEKYNILSIDLLGHGETGCLGYVHTMEEMAEAVKAVLKENDVRKAVLVGHSLGGYVALAFAEKYPDSIKGLCLFNSTAVADSELKRKDRSKAINVVKKNHERYVGEVIPNLFLTTDTPELKKAEKKALEIASATSKQGIIAALEGMKIRDNRELVVKFAPCPVFYVIGKLDKLLPYQDLMEQSVLNENGSYFLSEKGGHLCFWEDKFPSLTALQKFIGKIT